MGNFHESEFTMETTKPALTPGSALGNQALLDKIDKLRELNVGSLVSLPQLVVVGDQSSGKSSVLESLTGFSFPRAAGLCTRYATQITCRREAQAGVVVSIIPRPDASDALKARLRKFHRKVDGLKGDELAAIFESANTAMGIRPPTPSSDDQDESTERLDTFSEDILKIEIKGPDQPNLTIIDVPGIFRSATPGVTTDNDILLVTNMVKSYMKDSRTIILAVIPCNVDIATQEILKLAKDADPEGFRTMGVLTKPDLAPERAMQQNIVDLIQGKRQDLKLGYCVVKNRGADDEHSGAADREKQERIYFRDEPWLALAASKRVGTAALRVRLNELLMNIAKKEFPKVKADVSKMLADCRKKLEEMGEARSDEQSQRAYLGKLATNFERVVRDSLNAYYKDPIFKDLSMRLITRSIYLNKKFIKVFVQRGHTRLFDRGEEEVAVEPDQKPASDDLLITSFELPSRDSLVDPDGIVLDEPYQCPEPSDDSIIEHLAKIYQESRGPELGTFGGALLATSFKEQSQRWQDIVLSHVSDTIVLVHQFILDLLDHVVTDQQVKADLYDNVLLEKLQASYQRAMSHARFLLDIELDGNPMTYNNYFTDELQRFQSSRLEQRFASLATEVQVAVSPTNSGFNAIQYKNKKVIPWEAISGGLSADKSNPEHVRESLHDILRSYYKISMKRFQDVVCQQVINHFLLIGPKSPLRVFSPELVFALDANALEAIAGEDEVTKSERHMLNREIDSLKSALKVLRG